MGLYKAGQEHQEEQREEEAPGWLEHRSPPNSAGESTQEGSGEAGKRVDGTVPCIKVPGSRLCVSKAATLLLSQGQTRSQL